MQFSASRVSGELYRSARTLRLISPAEAGRFRKHAHLRIPVGVNAVHGSVDVSGAQQMDASAGDVVDAETKGLTELPLDAHAGLINTRRLKVG